MPNAAFVPVESDDGTPEIGVGVLGHGFMGRAHTNAYKKIPYIFWPQAVRPRLIAMCGRDAGRVAEQARRYGYAGYYTDWRAMLDDDRIQLFDNSGPHAIHVEPTIAALEAGKHVICEKPLALNSADAQRMLLAAQRAGVKHMCGFNYRFIPAIRLARELLDRELLGRIYHFRCQYLQESAHDPDEPLARLPDRAAPGAGTLANLGCHIIDLSRFLLGEPVTVQALVSCFEPWRLARTGERVRIGSDDAFTALIEFDSGAVGTLEASRVATGRKNRLSWEINGSRGSLAFDLERLNELQVYLEHGSAADLAGFQDVLVTEAEHPLLQAWWPRGHILGWEHAHINQLHHFLEAIARGIDVAPYGATFEDGYRAAVVTEAIEESSRTGQKLPVRP
jgi:predicted dehydrogenase